ncbi:cytochrome c [Flavobacterium sp. NG2]|uniref:cytochrome c n=1 Tax=Flavobacterium sp. NG2 TaxID=3097547 RepID=UPI002A7F7067|nr:cytochrome c [Flavobacterium sp. NG2]WPR70595.1 cytochrome c [Flavobacterium sp. NG2]
MKKILKIIGLLIISLFTIAAAGYVYINATDVPKYETLKIDYQVKSDSLTIKRGKKLALMLCANCHMNHETGKLTGTKMLDAPTEFGEIYSQNITQDKTYGIGNWTDAEILYLLRTGVKKDGQYTPPYMAKLPHMADDDINAIISFLRSDDPLMKADPTPDTPTKPAFLTKLLCRVAWKPFPLPSEKIQLPDTTNTVALGKYLAINLDCYSCHSADFKTNNFLEPELSKGYFAGGNKPLNRDGKVMLTPNLTPDKETGIGNWSKEKFIKAVRFGIVDDKTSLAYPMTPYTLLTDKEVAAIYDYLQTIPPIKNKVQKSQAN